MHAKYLFYKGNTENIMDYTWFNRFNSSSKGLSKVFLTAQPPNGSSHHNAGTNIYYGAQKNKNYYKPINSGNNPNKRISFFKWQWALLQKDDEVIKTTNT